MTDQLIQALEAYTQGRYEEAMQQFASLASENSQDAQMRILLGAAYREAGYLEAAKIQFQEVLKLAEDPRLADCARASLAQLEGGITKNLNQNGGAANYIQNQPSLKPALLQSVIDAVKVTQPAVLAPQRVPSQSRLVLDRDLETRNKLEGEQELAALGSAVNQMADQLQSLLRKREVEADRARLLVEINSRIRESLDSDDIFGTAVNESRQVLQADRVLIYSFDSEWNGTVVAESVGHNWPSALGAEILDPCFRDQYVVPYQNGRISVTENIFTAGLTECHLKQLEPFAVKANLVVPILTDGQLHGLLIAHQCSGPRVWKDTELDFFKQVAVQVGYALSQATLLTQVEQARRLAESAAQEQRQQKEAEARRAQSFADMTLQILQSLNLEDILNVAVNQVQTALQTERVFIYRFDPDWSGTIIAEAVATGFPSCLSVRVTDTYFTDSNEGVELYRKGRIFAINDIYTSGIAECHIQLYERLSIKANLIAPIVIRDQLLGLICAQQCSGPRVWQETEIKWLRQVATQVGVALEQANLLTQVEQARQVAETISQEQRQQKETLQHQLIELLSDIEAAASGDLSVRAEITGNEIGTVADFFNAIIENLRQIVVQVKQAATQVNTSLGSNQVSIRHLADEALHQAEETTRTLDSVERMTQSIQAVAESARQAASVARTASTSAEAGGIAMDSTVRSILNLRETVAETAKKVKRLGESSQQISKVVLLIKEIALQTNLLSINASIEAARAGEEGRGFAVVAEEVGALAARSVTATKEIEQIVENIQLETSEVVKAMELGTVQVVEGTRIVEDAKQSLGQILTVSYQIDELVQSISGATVSQAQSSQAVTQLMQEIAAVSQRTSDTSRQVSDSLRQTVEVAQQLQASVDMFKVDSVN
ncbi:GAF domain-containing protein [Leptolyngbya sp. FACHB-261]|uniref:GAF domain-containing protein n=1 Tax=Leptolyngbya sp. FACHB-261 TaxID=2692806 RepID=UPI001686EB89|nr:GAF domain-containing protein [Leptolyngbya sp. FACHB-261]MBD2101691.1 GAF domain-containing protein [Leptolyngbya sp. FACHB-261]